MSDNSSEPAFDADSLIARCAAYRQRGTELSAVKKPTLFAAPAATEKRASQAFRALWHGTWDLGPGT